MTFDRKDLRFKNLMFLQILWGGTIDCYNSSHKHFSLQQVSWLFTINLIYIISSLFLCLDLWNLNIKHYWLRCIFIASTSGTLFIAHMPSFPKLIDAQKAVSRLFLFIIMCAIIIRHFFIDAADWTHFKIRNLDAFKVHLVNKYGFTLPTLPMEHSKSLLKMALGRFRLFRGILTCTLQRRLV